MIPVLPFHCHGMEGLTVDPSKQLPDQNDVLELVDLHDDAAAST